MMKIYSELNVVARLTIGFISLFVFTTAVSIFAVVKLNQFNKASTHMLDMSARMTEYQERLSDALLSQVLYEKKYVILTDNTLLHHFHSAGSDFSRYLDEAIPISDNVDIKEILANVSLAHVQYQRLFEKETKFIKAHKTYNSGWYKAEKEKLVEGIIEELNNLGLYVEDHTKNRIKGLVNAGTKALRLTLIMAILSLIISVIIAFGITRSITRPLSIMKRKTREISRGNFEISLNLSSPPEIGELAQAFNLMCRKLSEMDKMKSDFFSLMAHELRTPLSSIKAGINLLGKDMNRCNEEKKERVLAIVSEECSRLINLVNLLLDLSKMEAGMITFDLAPGEIRPLIERTVAEIEPLSVSRGIGFELDIEGETPYVMIDSERILQVLRNLIGNALKFAPQGSRIKVSLRPSEGGLEISVADSGPGIDSKDQAIIFDKYKQLAAGGSVGIKGTGLGLALAKHIICAHGGRIWVESELERGSTFTVFLPA